MHVPNKEGTPGNHFITQFFSPPSHSRAAFYAAIALTRRQQITPFRRAPFLPVEIGF